MAFRGPLTPPSCRSPFCRLAVTSLSWHRIGASLCYWLCCSWHCSTPSCTCRQRPRGPCWSRCSAATTPRWQRSHPAWGSGPPTRSRTGERQGRADGTRCARECERGRVDDSDISVIVRLKTLRWGNKSLGVLWWWILWEACCSHSPLPVSAFQQLSKKAFFCSFVFVIILRSLMQGVSKCLTGGLRVVWRFDGEEQKSVLVTYRTQEKKKKCQLKLNKSE